MLLIADSGSTKTSWALCQGEQTLPFRTLGFHPKGLTVDIARDSIAQAWPHRINYEAVTEVSFYGAGCLRETGAAVVRNILTDLYPNASVDVRSDLEGTAISTLGQKIGIAAILGTGSSAAYWDGETLTEVSPSLGYILGDEGSAADLGIQILRSVLYGNTPPDILETFRKHFPQNTETIIAEIYGLTHPGQVLGQIGGLLEKMPDHPFTHALVNDRLLEFINRHILPLAGKEHLLIGFNGSVAAAYEKQLRTLLREKGYDDVIIVKEPLPQLITFHKKTRNS